MDNRVCGPSWMSPYSFKWLLPLAGLGATESGVDRRVLGIVIVASMLVFVASGSAVAVSGFRSCSEIRRGLPM